MSWFIQQALAGNCFFGSTTQGGVTLPAEDATAQTFALWNPAGSGVYLVLNKLALGQADATTPAITGIGLSFLTNAGSSIATGAPISAFTATTPQNARIGNGPTSKARFSLSATTVATAFLMSLGLSQDSVTPGTGIDTATYDFGGSVILPPGTLIALCGAPAAPGQDFTATIHWAEVEI